ncbi:hypothetical protein TSAR_016623 [Trichomalopsis sarcophagae]|uniref:Uncharacterized protein n=1 Tax=Trichomalopsis sarcophagae TaxID=543379 RepID=A0A232FDQ7_9HYME|nr:hypothetical protein TSAR_016623 [Trichomalopsis sarcophagae]
MLLNPHRTSVPDDASILNFLKRKRDSSSKIEKKIKKKFCICTDVNVAEVLLLFLNIFKKHSLTWMALLDIFEVLNYIVKANLFPVTKYSVQILINVNNESLSYHIVCEKCNKYFKRKNESKFRINCRCGSIIKSSSVGSFFIEINPTQQLQRLFEDPIVINAVEERFDLNKLSENALEDIFDGKIYKEYSKNTNLLGNPYNFSYTFNTDGCKSADSSKVTIWPIYIYNDT